MIGVDTNVLVRFLTQDDPAQAKKATAFMEESAAAGKRLLIHPVVLCELVWVLETCYGCAKDEVAPILDRILRTAQFEIPEKETAWAAWAAYRNGRGDFADHLIGLANQRLGAAQTVTFDRDLAGCQSFKLL